MCCFVGRILFAPLFTIGGYVHLAKPQLTCMYLSCSTMCICELLGQCVDLLAVYITSMMPLMPCYTPSQSIQACAAYCFITIPSVNNILLQLQLYLISGRVAIANGAMSQGKECTCHGRQGNELCHRVRSWLGNELCHMVRTWLAG